MTHKPQGSRAGGGNPAISRSSTAVTTGKYTPSSNYSGPRNSAKKSPMVTVRLGGGHTGKAMRHPYSRGCD